MEAFLTILVIWVIYKILNSSSSTHEPTKRDDLKDKKSNFANKNFTKTKKLSQNNYVQSQRVSVSSKERTYLGPQFAQPGEKSNLFGYGDFSGQNLIDEPFSIIDLETSGFSPTENKILEIAILKIDKYGNELERFTTLINPETDDVGRSDIHKISLEMLKDAPTFQEVSGRLFEIIENSIVVAHNARFEENFLFYEFLNCGHELPIIPALDTLWLARKTQVLPNYKLETLVSSFNLSFHNQHTALGDVVAVSNILPKMLSIAKPIFYPTTFKKLPKKSVPFKSVTR